MLAQVEELKARADVKVVKISKDSRDKAADQVYQVCANSSPATDLGGRHQDATSSRFRCCCWQVLAQHEPLGECCQPKVHAWLAWLVFQDILLLLSRGGSTQEDKCHPAHPSTSCPRDAQVRP